MIAEAVVTGWSWLIVVGIFVGAFLGGMGFGQWLREKGWWKP